VPLLVLQGLDVYVAMVGGGGGSSSSLTVEEEDGSPSVSDVDTIKVTKRHIN